MATEKSLFPSNCKNASMHFFQLVDSPTWAFFSSSGNKARLATVDNKQPHWLDLTFAPWTLSAVTLFLSVESVFPQTRCEYNPALFFQSVFFHNSSVAFYYTQGSATSLFPSTKDLLVAKIWAFAGSLFHFEEFMVFLLGQQTRPWTEILSWEKSYTTLLTFMHTTAYLFKFWNQ